MIDNIKNKFKKYLNYIENYFIPTKMAFFKYNSFG